MEPTSKNQRKKSQNMSQETVSVKKKSKWQKRLFTVLAIIGVAALAWMVFILFGNKYKTNALQMKENATIAYRLSSFMLNDYLDNWISVETEKVGKNAEGMIVSTDKPSDVLKWRQEFFKNNGGTTLLENLLNQLQQNYDKMGLTPAKYRDTQGSFDNLLTHVKAFAALTTAPGDSLLQFASTMNDLQQEIKDDLEASDFNFFISYDDLKAKVDELAVSFNDKSMTDALTKDVEEKSNSAIHAMKYKKMGFVELPKGKGVLFHEIKAGKGRKPKDDTNLQIHYEGKLMDGTIFDSSYQRGQPAVMRPSQTVPGFWHALTSMKEGAKWEIFIPYSQAYGNRAAGAIKPFSDLFFTIEIIGWDE